MNFASDNWAGATDAVMAALTRHNSGFAPAYGGDDVTASVTKTFCEIFEREVAVYFVASGTGANALSMAAAGRPGGLIFCSDVAHLHNDEYGASEFFTGGMKLIPIRSDYGIIVPEEFTAALALVGENGRSGPVTTLSLTNATECGTVYPADHIAALAEIAKRRDMVVHIDGARFANAVAALRSSPAELTWKAGVDLMSFGGTKNGCWAAEAIVVFDPSRFPNLPILRQRAGHLMSKARFVAAQFEGYFADGGWLKTAGHANEMAARLQSGLFNSKIARPAWSTQANEVFPILSRATATRLREAGAVFHTWTPYPSDMDVVRLVTSFATTADEVDRFLALL